jgi:hypothetical protein
MRLECLDRCFKVSGPKGLDELPMICSNVDPIMGSRVVDFPEVMANARHDRGPDGQQIRLSGRSRIER